MTREEIVRSFQYNMTNAFIEGWYEKNHERYTEEIEDVFYEGAEAAQKYFIEKACEWFINSLNQLHNEYGNRLEFANKNDFIKAFKKAMEE